MSVSMIAGRALSDKLTQASRQTKHRNVFTIILEEKATPADLSARNHNETPDQNHQSQERTCFYTFARLWQKLSATCVHVICIFPPGTASWRRTGWSWKPQQKLCACGTWAARFVSCNQPIRTRRSALWSIMRSRNNRDETFDSALYCKKKKKKKKKTRQSLCSSVWKVVHHFSSDTLHWRRHLS